MTPSTAALAAAVLLVGIALFHTALAFGMPWAAYAWGGQAEPGRLPPRLKLGSTILAPFIAAMAIPVLIRGYWLYPEQAPTMTWATWAVFLFVVTQFFGALRSQSRPERRRMMPVYGITAVLCLMVAYGVRG